MSHRTVRLEYEKPTPHTKTVKERATDAAIAAQMKRAGPLPLGKRARALYVAAGYSITSGLKSKPVKQFKGRM